VSDAQGSTVPRRQLGRYLKDLREKAGITVQAGARALEWSTAKLWRIETGQVAMRSHDVETMCRVYRAPADMTHALVALAGETKARGWWHAYGDAIPEWFQLYVGLETAATQIRKYDSELVSGLLQTKAYAYAFIEMDRPEMSPDEMDRRVAIKLQRQSLLIRRLPPPPRLEIILGEAVLRRPIRDREAMAGQLRHVATVADELPHVTVRVLPLAAGPCRASGGGPFALLDFDGDEPTTVYSEGPTGGLYLDKPAEAAVYDAIWNSVAEQTLCERESLRLIAGLAEEYEK
jgi:transcriptional regulator with XRE-family HTH domain